ncbi:MAG: methionine--tRNA ligase [Myxococcales bacterium]
MRKLLVTSALPYANGPIHLGHLVEAIQTDVFVRFQRLAGREAIYVCADDTHGTPIELNARKQGIPPEELVARVGEGHRRDFADFGIDFAAYGSTNLPANERIANEIFARLKAAGHIERRAIELTYCEKDGRFLPDRFVRGVCPKCGAADQYGDVCENCKSTYSPTDLKEPRCALCGTPPVRRPSQHYFFVLEHFRPLLEGIAAGTAEPELDPQVRNFLKGWLDQALQDWCVSRDGPYFGFPIPNEENKFFYVWLDAPIGYISNTPGPWAPAWKPGSDAEIWHFIGKDIIYFHALFWPAMLQGSGHRLPHRIVVHGMLNVRGEKMSKSRGRLRTAREYLEVPGLVPEHLRYYFAANLTPEPSDIDLNVQDFRHRVNAELVNNLANFCHRTLSLLRNRFEGGLRAATEAPIWAAALENLKEAVAAYEAVDFRDAVSRIVKAGDLGNGFLQERKPWAAEASQAQADLSLCANLAYGIAVLLSPVVPRMAAEVLRQLGRPGATLADLDLPAQGPRAPWIREGRVIEGPALMPRIEAKAAEALLPEETTSTATPTATATAIAAPTGEPKGEISFDAFAALDLRCGVVLSATAVPGATKLLRLAVDLGEGAPREIASGIAEAFAPAELVGRHVVVIANLAPKTIRGIRSHGMLLAAGEGKSLSLVELPSSAPAGARVR